MAGQFAPLLTDVVSCMMLCFLVLEILRAIVVSYRP